LPQPACEHKEVLRLIGALCVKLAAWEQNKRVESIRLRRSPLLRLPSDPPIELNGPIFLHVHLITLPTPDDSRNGEGAPPPERAIPQASGSCSRARDARSQAVGRPSTPVVRPGPPRRSCGPYRHFWVITKWRRPRWLNLEAVK